MDDEDVGQLVHAAAGGDRGAYEALVRRFSGLVWSIARSFRLGQAEAEDVSQVVWLRFVEHMARIREPDRAGAWLATTTRRECLAVVRSRQRLTPSGLDQSTQLGRAIATLDPDVAGNVDRVDDLASMRRALEAVGEPCKALLQLLFIEPRPSYEEIGAALEIPIGSIGPTRARCLDKLRRHPEIARITGSPRPSESPRSEP